MIHGPYIALTALSYRLAVWGARERAFVQIAPNVFLGRRLTEAEARRIELWPAVLDLAGELTDPPFLRAVPHYRSLPLLDATAPTQDLLREAVGWVKDRAAHGPVYVHCALGHGRSALVVAAYLLATGTVMSAKEAVAYLRGLRPAVRLNRAQRAALNRFAGGLATSAPSA
ncbi:dual specificity protein phosphatase family protein [Gemmata sp. JC673]|uniref:Dual specificity protein phosphatase family protein n=1 Tax=Gemmata algarum TaxID=2975278 RepID=A0ABU5ERJ7_9BACT|nr:dual specificity protein phosphatase family protein [Gemmata algarum]MDY3557961.1 dual specificity protein phosphatase family protein [Gemmata algarum]